MWDAHGLDVSRVENLSYVFERCWRGKKGTFLVRTAWERQPEGPAYPLFTVKLLYLAGQCAFFFLQHTFPPIGSLALGGFSRVPADGSFLQVLNFEIQDLSPLANRQQVLQGGS